MTAPTLPQPSLSGKPLEGLTPAEARVLLLRRAGVNVKAVAEAEGFHSSYAYHLIAGRKWNRRLAAALARAVRRPVRQLFPEQFEQVA